MKFIINFQAAVNIENKDVFFFKFGYLKQKKVKIRILKTQISN